MSIICHQKALVELSHWVKRKYLHSFKKYAGQKKKKKPQRAGCYCTYRNTVALVFWILISSKIKMFFSSGKNIQNLVWSRWEKYVLLSLWILEHYITIRSDAFPPLIRTKISHSFWSSSHYGHFVFPVTEVLQRERSQRREEGFPFHCEFLLFRISTSSWQQRTKAADRGFIPILTHTSSAAHIPCIFISFGSFSS